MEISKGGNAQWRHALRPNIGRYGPLAYGQTKDRLDEESVSRGSGNAGQRSRRSFQQSPPRDHRLRPPPAIPVYIARRRYRPIAFFFDSAGSICAVACCHEQAALGRLSRLQRLREQLTVPIHNQVDLCSLSPVPFGRLMAWPDGEAKGSGGFRHVFEGEPEQHRCPAQRLCVRQQSRPGASTAAHCSTTAAIAPTLQRLLLERCRYYALIVWHPGVARGAKGEGQNTRRACSHH